MLFFQSPVLSGDIEMGGAMSGYRVVGYARANLMMSDQGDGEVRWGWRRMETMSLMEKRKMHCVVI